MTISSISSTIHTYIAHVSHTYHYCPDSGFGGDSSSRQGPLCDIFIDHLATPDQFACRHSLSYEQERLERKVARRDVAVSERDAKITRLRKTYGIETLWGVGLVKVRI
nr:hypothetical protein [Tanacetum cinerariifolium]